MGFERSKQYRPVCVSPRSMFVASISNEMIKSLQRATIFDWNFIRREQNRKQNKTKQNKKKSLNKSHESSNQHFIISSSHVRSILLPVNSRTQKRLNANKSDSCTVHMDRAKDEKREEKIMSKFNVWWPYYKEILWLNSNENHWTMWVCVNVYRVTRFHFIVAIIVYFTLLIISLLVNEKMEMLRNKRRDRVGATC